MSTLYKAALSELDRTFERLNDADVDKAIEMIAAANKVVVFGGGRERLQIMGFAMRLFHLGLAVAVEGDMTTPPLAGATCLLSRSGRGRSRPPLPC
jgi:6-phospho-3-hexuloisomerase